MEIQLSASTSPALHSTANKLAVLLTADQLMIARDPHFNLSELTRCLQPSPAQPSQPSPGQHRLLLFTQWSSATAQPRPTTAQPPPISWSRAARTVTPSRDQCHVSRVTTSPATCTTIT